MGEVLGFFEGLTILSFVKLLLVVGLAVYVFFAFLMFRQIESMNAAVKTADSFVIRILGIAHLVFAILVLFVAIVAL